MDAVAQKRCRLSAVVVGGGLDESLGQLAVEGEVEMRVRCEAVMLNPAVLGVSYPFSPG